MAAGALPRGVPEADRLSKKRNAGPPSRPAGMGQSGMKHVHRSGGRNVFAPATMFFLPQQMLPRQAEGTALRSIDGELATLHPAAVGPGHYGKLARVEAIVELAVVVF